ncbi:DNA-binding transcriptional LysR family regulator [Clostridium acetobutylicum]|uniref:Transcriptional regulator, LysR family n=1 Tax=Clostridium acetobutylicum (strain ATCC 824 / DSM 792 / JCM 1419 / IAM 19013 / LMG 5710 / NBRC 13948 / NRRL B-527 / VKM B-1787 / 2291 / W) TaxID=272562 RepID=Q97FN8_CLOAB|nr:MULTISPECIES: LysR family transcriptional regulator [Clostridium]AAK80637.1 Transcriptional regulator, LysR family [Clostridium acetobutylicum ATCC 824]ADZ21736.1 Transcriptional regulator, LysR family [Clostridium acetobutylicum EA 2018]AEI34464.1 LysR family transcriptional regulator [Clostridium acetobutylicum DSM 1731]AWV78946.1 LysR family transcriptional regulator [Clostridium acetobutylicum]MBC2395185.1 LysR family transcriptional regulator [Clostridium acetobutylicum]
MNLRQLEYFVTLSETLSFTKTAQKFFISQTAVTKQIKLLENTLDTKLFNRNKHYVELTPAGNVFLMEAKAILLRVEEATERVHLTTIGFVGLLRIGFIKGYEKTAFSDLIFQLYNKYPNISITFFRGTESELYEKVLNSELDIVFNSVKPKNIDKTLEMKLIDKYPLKVVVHPTHPLAARKSVRFEELRGETIFKYNDGQDIEVTLLMVSANMGIAVMPSYCVRYLSQSQNLMIIAVENNNFYVDIAAVWNKENNNPALLRVLQIIKEAEQ